MKVKVDENKCVGCGACVAIADENFDFNSEGVSSVINDKVTKKTKLAAKSCPVYAISIEEDGEKRDLEKDNDNSCNCGDNCKCKKKIEDCDVEDEEAA